ncbi:MAG TPA: ATP-binding cassette domain-containing protein, partial [Savagea sp.]
MIVLQVNKLTKTFSGLPILQNVQLQVQHRDRVALVGRNGAGKSTLLKIIAGEMSYDSGDIIIPKDVSVGYLEQHAHLDSHLSIWDEMLTVFDDVLLIEREMRKAEIELGQINPENEVSYTQKLEQYAQLQASFEAVGGYQY